MSGCGVLSIEPRRRSRAGIPARILKGRAVLDPGFVEAGRPRPSSSSLHFCWEPKGKARYAGRSVRALAADEMGWFPAWDGVAVVGIGQPDLTPPEPASV